MPFSLHKAALRTGTTTFSESSFGFRPKRTIRAVMFVNEENGLRGGIAYAAASRPGERPIAVDDASAINTSFPGFIGLMNGLGADIQAVAAKDLP